MVFGKKHKRNIKGLVGVGMLSGAGSIAISKVGGSSAGLATASSYYPMAGSVIGAGMAMDAMKGLRPKKRKR